MNQSQQSVQGYDRLAKVYRWLEYTLFGGTLQRSRVALLHRLAKIDHALVLGDGDGRFLQQLCLAQPNCSVTSVDQSERMLRLQRQRVLRVGASDRVEFVCQDARAFRARQQCDLLVAAFFLDCFSEAELTSLLPRWLASLRDGGIFYFVDFVQPRSGWRRYQAAAYLTAMHWLFRWQTNLPNRRLVDMDRLLDRQSILLPAWHSNVHPMITCRCYRRLCG